ncbi:hypothetical protein EKG40_04400 [Pseudomonas moorei]|nr:hypothetical protein EKG40_04400 [Pseudomonas moorei]
MTHRPPVGASLLAMVVNDNAGNLIPNGPLSSSSERRPEQARSYKGASSPIGLIPVHGSTAC